MLHSGVAPVLLAAKGFSTHKSNHAFEASEVLIYADGMTQASSGLISGLLIALMVTFAVRFRPRARMAKHDRVLENGWMALLHTLSCFGTWAAILIVALIHTGARSEMGFVQRTGSFSGLLVGGALFGAKMVEGMLRALLWKPASGLRPGDSQEEDWQSGMASAAEAKAQQGCAVLARLESKRVSGPDERLIVVV